MYTRICNWCFCSFSFNSMCKPAVIVRAVQFYLVTKLTLTVSGELNIFSEGLIIGRNFAFQHGLGLTIT